MLANCKIKSQFHNFEKFQMNDSDLNQLPTDNFSTKQNNTINDENYLFSTSLNQSTLVFAEISENKSSAQKTFSKYKNGKKMTNNRKTYICKICGKNYLSYPALYTHSKNKHNDKKIIISKPRGRPKKEEIPIDDKILYNPFSLDYFLKEKRRGCVKKTDFQKCINEAFNLLKKQNFNIYKDTESHNFFKKFSNDEHDGYKIIINEHEIIDKVFMGYLNRISLFCNNEYFIKVMAYVVLFRDFINIKKEIDNYTEENEVDDIPYLSNQFVKIYFSEDKNENYFGFSFDDAVELMLNLCQWMFDNGYTCVKLTINEEVKKDSNFL